MPHTRCIDEFTWDGNRKILTPNELRIPGLDVFGHCIFERALQPLLPHWHGNTYEFSIVTKGHQIYYDGQKDYSLTGGNVFISYPYAEHSSSDLPDEKKELFWFRLDMDVRENFMGLARPYGDVLYNEIQKLTSPVLKLNADPRSVLSKSFSYFSRQTDYARFMGQTLLLHVIQQIIESERSQISSEISEKIQTAAQYVRDNVYETIELETMAQLSGLSLPRFKQRFTKEMGMPPREYINLIKIDKAKELLLQPGKSVTDVAFELGFSSSTYFTVVFKRVAQNSPTAYVRSHRFESQTEFLP